MYIRRTTIKSRQRGEPYYTYRLVESERIGGKVKQRTVLNLGRHFELAQQDWPMLVARIEQLLSAQQSVLALELPEELEQRAQRYVSQIVQSRSEVPVAPSDYQEVDLNSVDLVKPRRVGVEHVALYAAEQLGLRQCLIDCGFNRHQLASALGTIIGRMAAPGSERFTHRWLQHHSGLGELIGYEFAGLDRNRLYQVSDQLLQHKDTLERHLYGSERRLFGLGETITLYDLTNTYFEGQAKANALAARGRSKEKRHDCPLVTLALVLDGSGFVRMSRVFAGNTGEPATLEQMIHGLNATPGATVVLDAGLSSQANLDWLVQQGYHYLVVSRERQRQFDETAAVVVKDQAAQQVKVQRVVDESTGEVRLYCQSVARQQKEQAMQQRFAERFEAALHKLAQGLHKKTGVKRYDKVWQRLGRETQKYASVAQHYQVKVEHDPGTQKATSIQWSRQEKPASQATHPGVYCLRTDLTEPDEATLWRLYTMLTDLEAVFRSLKSELGLRPIFHHKTDRVSGHLFISVLAYHLVHLIRTQLKTKGLHYRWQTLRDQLSSQQRVTVVLRQRNGKTVHIRKATRAEPAQVAIYQALGIALHPGEFQKTSI